jgi:hypothetical protein
MSTPLLCRSDQILGNHLNIGDPGLSFFNAGKHEVHGTLWR